MIASSFLPRARALPARWAAAALWCSLAAAPWALAQTPPKAPSDGVPDKQVAEGKAESLNMRLVGAEPLQGRTAYQPTIQHQGNRWIAYVGHHGDKKMNPLTGKMEDNGTSVVDVTDPKKPKYLTHIPGEEGKAEQGGAQMVRVCAGADLPKGDKSKFYMLRVFGNQAHEIWDVTAPEKPTLLTTIGRGLKGTHKNFWECDTGIAYLVSGHPQWRTNRMTQIYDLSDPAKPVFIRDFGLVGQQPGAGGPVPISLHGPISSGPKGNRVYFGYGTNTDGVLQIVDRDKLLNGPKEPTPENLLAPQVARLDLPPMHGAHTVFPLFGVEIPEFSKNLLGKKRDFIVVTDEAIQKECLEGRQMVWVVDVTTETKPFGVSSWTVPEASGNFCTRGGRFGTHSSNESTAPVFHKKLMFFAHFNAGVRVLDVRNPMNLKEVAWYIPAMTKETVVLETPASMAASGLPFTEASKRRAIQTNNVEVDERGYVYIVDRANTGLHILELTGPARNIADWSAAVKN
ncbi:LVIVD repeat-containing protein [Ramlibacter pinisoli]|uniref:Uncharacterized protein n=2 Tax=Ramlibacter TaxID=174951 RepID=A0A6N8IWV2_9BURK|nr:hypothetical protein [Ramlibacter pinisoli]MBA2961091.1 hypothetical protein [Ramlibacter sp. CGMCC 1.13660]MVQ31035.1 hypothetical protein [Ramlibacter pinisoli]